MSFLINTIISGIVYDLFKEGTKITYQKVFGKFYGNMKTDSLQLYNEFIEKINIEESWNRKEKVINALLMNETQYKIAFESELYNTNFAQRLDYVISRINSTRSIGTKINLEYLGEFLGFESANSLLKYYKYDEEPSYTIIECIAEKLGVNKEWLKFGESKAAFKTSYVMGLYAEEFLNDFSDEPFEFCFIVKDDKKDRQIILVKKYNELKYIYYIPPIAFYSHVGGTGQHQLLSLYNFFRDERVQKDINNVCTVSEEEFNNILCGESYCGLVGQKGYDSNRHILEDFVDIYHKSAKACNYKEWYGDDFLKMQDIVRIMNEDV